MTEKEKKENISNICRKCEYYGSCLTEHYRYVENLDNVVMLQICFRHLSYEIRKNKNTDLRYAN